MFVPTLISFHLKGPLMFKVSVILCDSIGKAKYRVFWLVMLQAFREEPALDVKCKDKFLILSAFVNEKVESMNLQDLVSWIFACFLNRGLIVCSSGLILKKRKRQAFINASYVASMFSLMKMLVTTLLLKSQMYVCFCFISMVFTDLYMSSIDCCSCC